MRKLTCNIIFLIEWSPAPRNYLGTMSGNHNLDNTTFLPLVAAAAGTVLIAGVFSAAAVALDEEDGERATCQNIGIAAEVISSNLLDGRSKRHASNGSGGHGKKNHEDMFVGIAREPSCA